MKKSHDSLKLIGRTEIELCLSPLSKEEKGWKEGCFQKFGYRWRVCRNSVSR